jgi:hypothetical protein
MMGERAVQRTVLQVPVTLEGGPDSVYMQLDTGSDQSMFYEVPFREIRTTLPTPLPRFVLERALIGQETASLDTFWLRPNSGRPIASSRARTIGTLGADFLRDRVLILDFPNDRFAFVHRGDALPAALERAASWTWLDARNDKLFVQLTIAGRTFDDVFFDSGSSAFPLIVRRTLWTGLTGRHASDSTNDILLASSWGRDVPLIGAPLSGAVAFGAVRIDRPLVYHHGVVEGVQNFFDTSPYPVSGYFGNAMFFDRFTVIVDVPRRRFGVIAH